jgi:hypothetical protein
MKPHVFTWVEIPVNDFDRAFKFYETILPFNLKKEEEWPNYAFFEHDREGVGGAIVKHVGMVPSPNGCLTYLNCGDDLAEILDKVEAAGGEIVMQKTLIHENIGYMAKFKDTEGNVLALHSQK